MKLIQTLSLFILTGVLISCNSGNGNNISKSAEQQSYVQKTHIALINNLANQKKSSIKTNGDFIASASVDGGVNSFLTISSIDGFRYNFGPWTHVTDHLLHGVFTTGSLSAGNAIGFFADGNGGFGAVQLPISPDHPINWELIPRLPRPTWDVASDGRNIVAISGDTIYTNQITTPNPEWGTTILPQFTAALSIAYSPVNQLFYVLINSYGANYFVYIYRLSGNTLNHIFSYALPPNVPSYNRIRCSNSLNPGEPSFQAYYNEETPTSGFSNIATSADGKSWNLESTPITEAISGVSIGNGIEIAVGQNGTIIQRNNGVWIVIYHFPQDNFEAKSLVFTTYANSNSESNTGNFIITAEINSQIETFTSENGAVWTNTDIPFLRISSKSAGSDFSCGLTSSIIPSLYCWGNGANGKLGYGGTSDALLPKLISTNVNYTKISSGINHACGLTDGTINCWGANANGQLGLGRLSAFESIPQQIYLPTGTTFSDIAVSESSTCALDTNGKAWCWGDNSLGQLGYKGISNHPVPHMVSGDISFKPTSLISGNNHFCATIDDQYSTAYCWGDNRKLQISINAGPAFYPTPIHLNFSVMYAGGDNSCTFYGSPGNYYALYCWGDNSFHQVENSDKPVAYAQITTYPNKNTPTFTGAMSIGNGTMCAIGAMPMLYAGNHVFCWGRNNYGQASGAYASAFVSPQLAAIVPLNSISPTNVSVGGEFTLITTAEQNTYSIGKNNLGQIGNNTRITSVSPTQINSGPY